jgi:hypothetical protein
MNAVLLFRGARMPRLQLWPHLHCFALRQDEGLVKFPPLDLCSGF